MPSSPEEMGELLPEEMGKEAGENKPQEYKWKEHIVLDIQEMIGGYGTPEGHIQILTGERREKAIKSRIEKLIQREENAGLDPEELKLKKEMITQYEVEIRLGCQQLDNYKKRLLYCKEKYQINDSDFSRMIDSYFDRTWFKDGTEAYKKLEQMEKMLEGTRNFRNDLSKRSFEDLEKENYEILRKEEFEENK